eukprot:m51a1_g1428 putative phosphomannomutase (470) ;mRNA; f:71431-73054
MSAPLMVTISGVRGIAGQSLVPDVVTSFVRSFAAVLRDSVPAPSSSLVVLGRDSRVSGPWVRDTAIEALLSEGFDVMDCGIVPTPTVQVMVQQEHAAGGLIVTSSHNPAPWNGLKFVDSDGLFLSPERCATLFALADRKPAPAPAQRARGTLTTRSDAVDKHLSLIFNLPYIKPAEVAACKFKVCLDAVCGAGGEALTKLLKAFGCEVVAMNAEPTGVFPHTPEPIPENLGDLCRAVREHKADLGIAVDPDVDRCVLIGEDGSPLGEEYTLALAVQFYLGIVGKRGPVCKNMSSSRASDDIAAKYGCSVTATPVGEIQVAKRMVQLGAVIGGEGNGGVMLPDVHIGRDAPVAAALTLQHLAEARKRDPKTTIRSLKMSLPQFEIVKLKTSVEGIDADAALADVRAQWEAKGDVRINLEDGLHISGSNWWVHLRKSNTEPIIRVIGEAPTTQAAIDHCKLFMALIESHKH